jgi:outer membrane protein OmpA-like peptidoglycan-associated protein
VLAIALAVLALASCAYNKGSVVLLPEKDGHDTAVVVTQGDKQVVLDRPYAAAQQTAFGARTYQSSEQEVAKTFGVALAAQPARPARFTLYFVEGKDELTEESRQTFESVFAEILKHPVPDIVVIGHTDRVGTDPFNDNLARQRADTVRMSLISRGVAPDNVVAAGRGSREPIVPTDAGVSEPRNRRVEIFVR